ncbi:MAG: hypothetical protein EBQ68_09345 [Betaproteobacteria bacterium]|nr:hypothetical protein [Betaproteobacteria bacterium]
MLAKIHHPRSDDDNLSSFQESVETAIQTFFHAIYEQKSIKHFLFGISLEKIYENMKVQGDFVVLKPEKYYRDVISQTAPKGLQVTPNQFEDIYSCLLDVLKKQRFLKKQIPKLASYIIENIEETRALIADAEPNLLRAHEVSNETICAMFNRSRAEARIDSYNDVFIPTGFDYPFWTRVNPQAKEIVFGAQAFPVSASVAPIEIENISQKANASLGNFVMEVDTRTRHGPILFSLHKIKYKEAVPKRMLLRAAREFSSAFETAVSMDKYKYLVSALN